MKQKEIKRNKEKHYMQNEHKISMKYGEEGTLPFFIDKKGLKTC